MTSIEAGNKISDPQVEPSAEILAEHDAWFEAELTAYRKLNPPPVAAWDGNALYRMIQTHCTSFLTTIRPKAEVWWKERGFKIIWRKRGAILEPID